MHQMLKFVFLPKRSTPSPNYPSVHWSSLPIRSLLPCFPAAQWEWLVLYSGRAQGERLATEKLLPSNNLQFS